MIRTAPFRIWTPQGVKGCVIWDAVIVGRASSLAHMPDVVCVNSKTDMGDLLKRHGWRFA